MNAEERLNWALDQLESLDNEYSEYLESTGQTDEDLVDNYLAALEMEMEAKHG